MATWKQKAAAIRRLERNGVVDPNDLIAAARDRNHPCHGDFTWDLKKAAMERWRDQARKLIRQVVYERSQDGVVTERYVQYVADNTAEEDVFFNLPRTRIAAKVSAAMLAEIVHLRGVAARVYGIASGKATIVPPQVVGNLCSVCELLDECKAELEVES